MTSLFRTRTSAAFLFSALCLLAIAPLSASAHTLRIDGTIEGILHVNPGHLPTAGEKASFNFILKDTERSFAEGHYSILLSVADTQGVTVIVPLTLEGTTAKGPYIFPHEGDYMVTLTGSSTIAGRPPFRLVYDDITALAPTQHQNRITQLVGEHGGHLLVTLLIVLCFVAVIIWEKYEEKRGKKRKHKNP